VLGVHVKGWVKVVIVLIVVGVLLLAGVYVYNKWKKEGTGPSDGAIDGDQVVKLNESAVSIYLRDLEPRPSLNDLTVRLYAPGLGHVDRSLLPSALPGVLRSEDLFPYVDLEYHDLNNDSAAGNGDFFSVLSDNGPLRTGIWHVEVIYIGHFSGNVSFHFHALPHGVESIAEDAEVDFIDVGQGDAELVSTSDGRHVLIDAGPPSAQAALLSYLSNRSVTVLDALIISHPDDDHIGGADDVLRALEVRSVYHPGLSKNTSAYDRFIDAAHDEGCPIYTDHEVHEGDYLDLSVTEDFRVLSINASSTANDASIVVRVTAESRSFLFTGDISTKIEDALRSKFLPDIDVDVLKVAHHGSRTSSSAAFLSAVTPSISVIEVGTDNTYGHPTSEALARLDAVHTTIVRTDLAGDYAVLSAGGVVR
jgi:beta-lactamase superfamily II metal-dependent hydrolase